MPEFNPVWCMTQISSNYFCFRIELKSCILSAPGDKQRDAVVASKLLRDPPKCTATKPITQDFTKLRKGTFTLTTNLRALMINPSIFFQFLWSLLYLFFITINSMQ